MIKLITISALLMILSSCSTKNHENRYKVHKPMHYNHGHLVHMVYFDLKDEIALDTVFAVIEQLRDIEELLTLDYGKFKNLKDPRAFSNYEVFMSMSMQDEEAYQRYQAHPLHLQLKKKAETWLAAPPATYDFIVE